MQRFISSLFTPYRDNETISGTVFYDEDTVARDVFVVQIVKVQEEGLPNYGENVIRSVEVPMSVVRSHMASEAYVKTIKMGNPTMPLQANIRAVRFLTDDVLVIRFEQSIFLVHMDGSVAPEDILWFDGFCAMDHHPPVADGASVTETSPGVAAGVAATGPQAHQLLLTTMDFDENIPFPLNLSEFTTSASIVTLSSDLKSVVSTHTVEPLPTHAFAITFIDGGNRYVIGGEGKTTVFDTATNAVLYDCVHEDTKRDYSQCMGIQQVLVPGIVGPCLSLIISTVVRCVYDNTGKFQLRVDFPSTGIHEMPTSWTLL
jgi:hypothetical protein